MQLRFRFTVRCLAAFAAGGALAALFNLWVFRPGPQGPRIASLTLFLAGQFICGALAGVILAWRTAAALRTAAGFGVAFAFACFVSLFVSMSLQGGGTPEYVYGAVGFGIAYGLGGALGSLTFSPRLALPAALAFGGVGAVTGILAFAMITAGAGSLSNLVETLLPWLGGGALLGLWVDATGGAPG